MIASFEEKKYIVFAIIALFFDYTILSTKLKRKIKNKQNRFLESQTFRSGFPFLIIMFVVFFGLINQVLASEIPQNYLKKIELKDRIYKMELDMAKHPEFFAVYTKYFYKNQEIKFSSGSTIFDYVAFNYQLEKREIPGINRGAIEDYIRKELVPKYDRVMQPVRIYRNAENHRIEFDGFAVDGRKIKVTELTNLIIFALQNEIYTIVLPFEIEPAKVTVEDPELVKMGIQDLISTGESDYSVSSWRRITNIRIGAMSFNGKLLQKDEIFSIGRELGAITVAKGYKPELVIKGTETVPELGGGLCQVATTVFRGALQGGFEIIERWQHAYAVFHYEPFGTDATIYPPLKDFKFKNNTSGAILLQSHLDEEKELLYVNYFGTKDAREVNILGPFVSHWKFPGTKRYETDPNQKYWQKQILNQYYNGFSVYWQRLVSLPEEKIQTETGSVALTLTGATLPKYEFFSTYRPAF